MALLIGDKAPDFTLHSKTDDGFRAVTLSESFGKKNTLILFFPMAFTGVCTTELCSVSQGLADYASVNATVLGISGDSPFALEAWAQKEGIKIPLLSDYEHAVAQAYGVAYEAFFPALPIGGVARRSAFIVDRSGVIQYAEVHDNPGELPDFAAISATLARLQ